MQQRLALIDLKNAPTIRSLSQYARDEVARSSPRIAIEKPGSGS
jgi:hypothetical protein